MDHDLLASLVASASTSDSRDPAPLAGLANRLWPGSTDATMPAALQWLRRWSPQSFAALVPDCACATGRCGSCN